MTRVGLAADDPEVSSGLRRLFEREAGVQVVTLPEDVDGIHDDGLDVVVLDVWPPTPGHAEALCAEQHRQHPEAAIIAVVHQPDPALLARVRRNGGTALWPKDETRALPRYALDLVRHGPAAAAVTGS